MRERQPLIFIVDDSPTTLQFTASVLRSAGFRVETTGNIWIAGMVREQRPELILMDVNLGLVKSGPRVVESLNRMTSARRMTRIFLYSSLNEDKLRELVGRCGADGFIRKGISPGMLVRRVKEALASAVVSHAA